MIAVGSDRIPVCPECFCLFTKNLKQDVEIEGHSVRSMFANRSHNLSFF